MLATVLLALSVFFGPANVAGNWRVEFATPSGEVGVTMTINQDGDKLTGRVINEDGEFDLKGTVSDDQVVVTWTIPEQGKPMEIRMSGRIEGEYITGTARLGDVGEGALEARRTSRNP